MANRGGAPPSIWKGAGARKDESPGLEDLVEETEEPVMGRVTMKLPPFTRPSWERLGRATMKWQSRNIVEKGEPVRNRQGRLNSRDLLMAPAVPPRPGLPPPKPVWELTPELMTQPWGNVLHKLQKR